MEFLTLSPFVPSGKDFESAKAFFVELGFKILWDGGNYAGLGYGSCTFILQRFDNEAFAQNYMVSVIVSNVEEFRNSVLEKKLPEKYGIRIGIISKESYGLEVNIIDKAGVCWHFIEQPNH